jgi:uncharacterized protein (TIGR03437 family)
MMLPIRAWMLFLLAVPVSQAADCSGTSTRLTPLNDPFFQAHHGFAGGLYPDRSNQRPAGHEKAGLRLAEEVRPRNAQGAVDDQNGKIVFLSIGMSNTTQEFSVFKRLADQDPEKNPRLVIVDGAQGGWSAGRIVAGGAEYWARIDERLAVAGVTPAQVQSAWMKEADARPVAPFPEHARLLQSEMQTIAQTLRSRFPNLRLLYLSSRTYGGYASTELNPEPYAYESGFAVKWLIEAQIRGEAELDFTGGRAPWLSWGPYLWADGTTPRDDGLVWNCADFAEDGTHPSASGREKVAAMLMNFLKSDTTARPWFVQAPEEQPPKPVAAAVVHSATYEAEVAPGSIAALFGSELSSSTALASELPLPTVLAGTTLRVGGEPVLLFYASPTQINWLVPKAPVAAEVVVVREAVESDPLPFSLAIYAPGIFTLDGTPGGAAAALHGDYRLITPADPALRGETIQIYLTGLGVRNPLLMRPDIAPLVRIGEVAAEITYSGPTGVNPGLDQINLKVPGDAPLGAEVPLTVSLGSSASNRATLAVSGSQPQSGLYSHNYPRSERK